MRTKIQCHDTRLCFAKSYDRLSKKHYCHLLTSGYDADGECPFAKVARYVTDGKTYPLDSDYGKGLAGLTRGR